MQFVIWGEKLGNPKCPYLKRWVFNFWLFSIRIHHWLKSDDKRAKHDHPWWFLSFVIKGGYLDCSESQERIVAPTIVFRSAKHIHTVRVPPRGAWTILLCGREKRDWGFWVAGKFRKRNKYFFEHGHHQCDN